jgi:hypothetical protein
VYLTGGLEEADDELGGWEGRVRDWSNSLGRKLAAKLLARSLALQQHAITSPDTCEHEAGAAAAGGH